MSTILTGVFGLCYGLTHLCPPPPPQPPPAPSVSCLCASPIRRRSLASTTLRCTPRATAWFGCARSDVSSVRERERECFAVAPEVSSLTNPSTPPPPSRVFPVFQIYESFVGPYDYLLCCGTLSIPYLLSPLHLTNHTPLRASYATKAILWLSVYSFIGNWFYTHYFYAVLKAEYTFPGVRINDVPIGECRFRY